VIAEARRVESSLFLEPGGPAICPATPARAKISGRFKIRIYRCQLAPGKGCRSLICSRRKQVCFLPNK